MARERATPETAVEENRAALIALAALFGDARFERVAGVAPPAARPPKDPVGLGGRHDFMQHFVISAGLAATGGAGLADAIGVLKVVDDSRFGTGFSFTDIAADRAGVRFAEAALDPERARRVQEFIGGAAREGGYFPSVADLPEFLDEAAFKRRFCAVDSPAYRSLVQEIERRIGSLPLHRGD
ncbi:MAG: hypothetical protein EXQ96_06165 [Alphaproteobacteria bacterium]|nr:hypothetical protein [Alphaproteobacteria bacterium]